MTGTYIYISYPCPFPIAVIKAGYYTGGVYYEWEADEFVSEQTSALCRFLLFQKNEPDPFPLRNCKSCEKICHNLTVHGDCYNYEPMLGLHGHKGG